MNSAHLPLRAMAANPALQLRRIAHEELRWLWRDGFGATA